MICVDYVDVSQLNREGYDVLYRAATVERRQRADRYQNGEDAVRCITAEVLLRYCLFEACGFCGEPVISYEQNGKPFVKGSEPFVFNFSHSGRWVAVAYCCDGSSEAVGVDVETVRKGDGWKKITHRFLSDREKKKIFGASAEEERAVAFTRIWTLKESYAKYLGKGLSIGLDTFSVDADAGRVRDASDREINGVWLSSIRLEDSWLSVCGESNEVLRREVQMEKLEEFTARVPKGGESQHFLLQGKSAGDAK